LQRACPRVCHHCSLPCARRMAWRVHSILDS
jgi:hypothetical protein